MKKVAIVGVEGSGKTVMLAGLGDLYTYPDEEGYFLSPKNFGTAAYVAEKIERMRKGEWPAATAGDEMQGLDWTLEWKDPSARRPPEKICEVSFLDFAGEVYRTAFGIGAGDPSLAEQAEELKRYVSEADDLIVLINLRDVIVHGVSDRRVQEAMWITNAIFDVALAEAEGHTAPRAAIVLSQADSYADTIKDCGGALGVLRKYLPHVANRYDWLDVFAASAVDKTKLDDDGNVVPSADFTSKGLLPIMTWVRGEKIVGDEVQGGGRGTTALPGDTSAEGARLSRREDSTVHRAGIMRTITLPGGEKMLMIYCPPGEFTMGSPETEKGRCDDEIQHRVTLTKGFWLGKYPVTQAQWRSVMGNYSSLFRSHYTLTSVSDFGQLGMWIAGICSVFWPEKFKRRIFQPKLSRIVLEAAGKWFGKNWSESKFKSGLGLLRVTRAALSAAVAAQEVADKKWWGRFRLRLDNFLQSIFKGSNDKTEKQKNVFEIFSGNDASPVGNVSWDNCQEFIQKVNAQLNCGARLPTEAEWEYACRAGTPNVRGKFAKGPSPVGQYPANPWGFFDMYGTVWEWCSDWYGDYPSRDVVDPTGPASGEDRILRGGSWYNLSQDCRSANRDRLATCDSDNNIGFRLCCSDV